MLFIFLIGVKTDPSVVLKSGKRTLAIGVLGFFLPFALSGFTAFMLNQFLSLDYGVAKALPSLVAMQSMTAFPVIACFLAELEILNSEIGRLASASSLICDVCHWSIMSVKYVVHLATTKSLRTSFGSFFSMVLLVSFIVFGIRPAALWAIQRTPEGRPVKEIYISAAVVALLSCGFIAETIGLSAFLASFLLGLVIPDGPPLGATLVERLDCFVSVLLMPTFFTTSGLKMDVFAIKSLKNVGAIQSIVLVAFVGKLVGTTLPPLLLRMPIRDALSLGLIMNSKGIVELAMLNHWRMTDVMNEECFAAAIISVVVVTGVISPIVKLLYDPSRRFVAYKRRTILHNRHNEELRILACIHNEENIPATLSLLNASNPTKESPINLCILHLVKLVGRASSILVAHPPREKSSDGPTKSERIFGVFRNFEQKNQDSLVLHCYKGVSPYSTMHNDVCSLALEKRITFIIIPFHKQWKPWGRVETSHAFRQLNKNVLEKAPCSVGILIEHSSRQKYFRSNYVETSYYRVAVLFFGGADDREALAYAGRMSQRPIVLLTLIRFSSSMDIVGGTDRSKMLDGDILNDFRSKAQRYERVSYQEEEVTDASDVIKLLRCMENGYDLILVGRRHGESTLMQELRKCSESADLGTIGNILATADFRCGSLILVVQQQTKVWGLRDPEESTRLRRIKL
ncbi:cation/H(+) antiporter 15-like isoform X2 [Rhodamnia argentea]|nr:cation/H(+) antiporter 15-like isoform X2 [Rhodamnia argentea]